MEIAVLVPIAWTICLHLAALGFGRPIYLRLAGGGSAAQRPLGHLFSSLLGFAVLAQLTFALGVARLLYAPLLVALVLGAAAFGLTGILRTVRRPLPRLRPQDALLVVAFLLAAGLLPYALDPVMVHDENTYHLLIPKQYLQDHTISRLPFNTFANMPHVVEMLYVPALAIGDLTAPRVLVASFTLLNVAGIAAFAFRYLGRPAAGILALAYLSGRNVNWHIGPAKIEPAVGFFLLCAVLALLAWMESKNKGFLWILAVGTGLAAASKYTVGPLAAVVFLGAAISVARSGLDRRAAVRTVSTVGLVSFGLVLPWLVKNAWFTGNPVYPAFYSLFDGRFWSKVQELHLARSMDMAGGVYESWLDWFAIPYRLTLTAGYFSGNFSLSLMALFLIAPLLPSSWRSGMWLLQAISVGGFLTWVFGIQNGRFLVAWVPVMALSGGMALAPLRGRPFAQAAVAAAVIAIAAFQAISGGLTYRPPFHRLSTPRQERIEANLNYDLCQHLNRTLPPDAKLLCMWENMFFFLERPFWADGPYEAPTALAWLRSTDDPAAFGRALRAEGITHVVINHRIGALFLNDKLAFPVLDEKEFPAERLARDRELLDRFVREHLELIHSEIPSGRRLGTGVYRLRTETLR